MPGIGRNGIRRRMGDRKAVELDIDIANRRSGNSHTLEDRRTRGDVGNVTGARPVAQGESPIASSRQRHRIPIGNSW